ncbi:polyprenyl synthetase family protein [Nocardia sp. BMG51109]|uniref:polyprenyl synthetase family protein n=1 Tax=Nocardia sp. BMG51109 TaxID=1056816 RepID=UPI00046423B5|nr:polyprenyl synthetase family protein [Nocardia sp. BMG51109]
MPNNLAGARPRRVAQILADSRSLLEPALRRWLSHLAEPFPDIAAYHYGLPARDGSRPPGSSAHHRLATLTLLASAINGDPWKHACDSAVACDLVAAMTLIHDDIIDGDHERRGRPTLWTAFGLPTAMLLGDALVALAFEILACQSHRGAAEASRRTAAMLGRACGAEATELAEVTDAPVTMVGSQSVLDGKAAGIYRLAAEMGALVCGADPEQVRAMRGFGLCVGRVAQLLDDLGDTLPAGPRDHNTCADIRNRTKSPMVMAALGPPGTTAGELAAFYNARGPVGDAETAHIASLLEQCGAREWTLRAVEDQTSRAAGYLDRARVVEPVRDELIALTNHLQHTGQ